MLSVGIELEKADFIVIFNRFKLLTFSGIKMGLSSLKGTSVILHKKGLNDSSKQLLFNISQKILTFN